MAQIPGLNTVAKTGLLSLLGKGMQKKGAKPALLGGLGVLGVTVPAVGNFIKNELLGLDDFERASRYASEGDFTKMLKSLAAGGFELGSTLIPSGTMLKAAKEGAMLSKAAPVGTRVLSMLPGLTEAGALTPMGTRALQGFRAAETGQLIDAVNSGANQLTGRGFMVGSAKMNAEQGAEEAYKKMVRERLLAQLMGGA